MQSSVVQATYIPGLAEKGRVNSAGWTWRGGEWLGKTCQRRYVAARPPNSSSFPLQKVGRGYVFQARQRQEGQYRAEKLCSDAAGAHG